MSATLSVTQVAELLGVSTWTIHKAIADGHLRKVPHTGRSVRLTPQAVEECFKVRPDQVAS